MNEIAIRTEDLTRTFGSLTAVDRLCLEVPAGSIFGFLGPNGAGKTTTLNLLLGLLEPTTGQAQVLGYDASTQAHEVRARCGALLEHSALYEQLSAEANLEFYGRIFRLPATERQARSRELLTDMGLWDRRHEKPGTWSKGMKQKLALARALLHRPALVFLDEPTSGLDVMAANAVRDDLEALAQREGVTLFLTTHNMVEAERLCNQVAVIRHGKLLAVGHPDQLRARAGGPRIEIYGRGFNLNILQVLQGRPEVAAAALENGHLALDLKAGMEHAPLVSLLVAAGIQVDEVRRGKASLEEAFLTLITDESPAS